MRAPRRVTETPTGIPSRSLKFAIDLRARRTFGCWPAIVASCSVAASSDRRRLLGVADAHVERDLEHARHLHPAGVAELLRQLADELCLVELAQARRRGRLLCVWCCRFQSVVVSSLFTRSLCRCALSTARGSPPSPTRTPTRVGLLSVGSRSMTLETSSGPSWSMMPLDWRLLRVLHRTRLGVALVDVEALDVDAAARRLGAQHAAGLALVLAGDHDHRVVLADVHALRHRYRTSGARETMRMKFRSRSSRATGPKMRVPRGAPWASISTAAFSSKAM